MGALQIIQVSINELKSSSIKIDADFKTISKEFSQTESNVCVLGNVFDSVKDTAETNRKSVENVRKNLDHCVKPQTTLEEKIASDL